MISMALSKLLMAFSNLFAFMLVLPKRMNKGATGFTRVARSRTSIAYELIARNYEYEKITQERRKQGRKEGRKENERTN